MNIISKFSPKYFQNMNEESLRHNVLMILLDILFNSEQPLTVKELVSKLGHYSEYTTFSRGLRRITGRGVDGLPVGLISDNINIILFIVLL